MENDREAPERGDLNAWMECGYDALEAGDLELAFEAGEHLRELRHSSCFEILGLAHVERGEGERAIEVLEEGVSSAPDVWLLWQLLGNCLSDAGRLVEAEAALQRALACEGAERDSVQYNQANVLLRAERPEAALDLLRTIHVDSEHVELGLLVARAHMDAFNDLGRHADAIRTGESTLAQAAPNADPGTLASLHAQLARALVQANSDPDRALASARAAIALDKHDETAQWALREVAGRISPDGKHFRLVIHGDWPDTASGAPRASFYTSYHVVADTPEQALELAAAFEPEALRPSLRIDELELEAPASDVPSGVYRTAPYSSYEREAP